MKPAGKLLVSTPGEREIALSREFDAAQRLVFDAYTKPELVRRWLGMGFGWTFEVCEIDFRVGGAYRFVWRGPDGAEMGMGGTYREIVAPERIVATEKYDQAWYEGDAVVTVTFEEADGRTTLTITVRYASKEVRDAVLRSPMESGVAAGFESLAGLLATLA